MRRDSLFSYLSLTPALLILGGVLLYPIAYAFFISFTRTDGLTFRFIGLGNYLNLIQDPIFWQVLSNNFLYAIAVPFILVASLFCAVLIYEGVWGAGAFRIIFFVPAVLSAVVVGIIFRTFFAFDGPVNQVLEAIGLSTVHWLAQGSTAMVVIGLGLVWWSFGYGMIILLAGMANIDPSVYEAADLDGASWLQRIWYVTLPLLADVMKFVSVINVIYVFTALFGFIFVMTSGGPGYATTTLDYMIYRKAFTSYEMGEGAALAVFLFVIILILTVLQLRVRSDRGGLF